MADGSSEVASSFQNNVESSESTVEVNVKTLDSQIYTFRVDKNIPVSVFKEKIASAVGLPVAQQRLIFRGKVLKDDHLLSEYHLEDGHTLHLVVRQPVQSQTSSGTTSGESSANQDNRGSESPSGAPPPHNRIGQVSHSVVLGTFNIGDQGEGIAPDLSRIVGAVLNSFGIGNLTTASGTGNIHSTGVANFATQPSQGMESEGVRENTSGRSQGGIQGHPAQAFPNPSFQTMQLPLQFPLPGAIAVSPLQMVIPDSLTTLSEFINRMELALSPNGTQASSSSGNVMGSSQEAPPNSRRLPTPSALVAVIRQAQQLLSGNAGAALMNIAGRLERDSSSSDTATRGQVQVEAMQVGVAMQHLGALLLELGRTILTLRMGPSPAEAVVNAGPAVYISSSGPNPIMVQPSPSLNSSPFAISSPVIPPGIPGPTGLGDLPRHINIHIHAVAPGISSVGARVNTGETNNAGQHSGQAQGTTNGTGSSDSAPRRVVPVRSVVAAVPARTPAEAAGHVLSVFYPLHARSQQTTGNSATVQVSNTMVSDGVQLHSGTSASQNSQPVSLPAAVAQVPAQSRNDNDNIQCENFSDSNVGMADVSCSREGFQAPSGLSEASTSEGSEVTNGSGIICGVTGSAPPNALEVEGLSTNEGHQGMGSSLVEVSSIGAAAEASNCPTLEGPYVKPEGQPSGRAASAFASELAANSIRDQEPSEGSGSVPLGLGIGGLQPPKRKHKQLKSQGKDGVNTTHFVNQSQHEQSFSRGQEVLQSLVSGQDSVTAANGPSGQLSSSFRQVLDSLPLGGQGANGQIDVASMMSQVLQSPAIDGLLAREQAGVGSPAGLRGILEQLAQSPSVRNTLNQIAQEVEGRSQEFGSVLSVTGREQGGINLSGMFQQLIPVVSQVLNQGSTRSELNHNVESGPQSSKDNVDGKNDQVDGNISKCDLWQSAEQLEDHGPSRTVFRAVLENASTLCGGENEDLIRDMCNNEMLTNEFLEMLQRDLHHPFHSESSSSDKS